MDERYNSWTNYETWGLALWLSREGTMYNFIGKTLYKMEADYDGAEWLKEFCEEHFEDVFSQVKEGTFWKDIMRNLFSASLSQVNWFEIAVNMRGDYNNEVDEEDEEDD